MKKKYINIAHKIVELEKRAHEEIGYNPIAEMNKLIAGLSPDALLEIDNYIAEKKLLTK